MGLAQGEDVVHVVAGLERRIEARGRIATREGHRDFQAFFVLLTRCRLERADDDEQPAQALGEVRRKAEAAFAAGHHDAHVGFGVPRGIEGPLDLALDALARREGQADAVGGPIHPIEVLAELERAAAIGARHLVDRVAVQETAIEHGYQGLLGRDQLPLDVHQYRHRRLPYRRPRLCATSVIAPRGSANP